MTNTTTSSKFNKKQFWSYKILNEKTQENSKNSKNTKNRKNSKDKTKKKFHIINDKVVTDQELIKRIESIYMPPAYKEVVIAKSENNKIQAIGTDTRGRRQYIYNTKYTKKRNERKYDDVMELGQSIIK